MQCPQCLQPFYFIKESNGDTCFCTKCNFSGSFIQPSYSNYHAEKYLHTRLRNQQTDPLIKEVFKCVEFKLSDLVLDYGCGRGDYVAAIAPYVKKIIGVDLSIEIAQKRFPDQNFQELKKVETDFPNNYFDKIISINTIEHIPKFEDLLLEMKRILKPGGKLFITTLDINFILHNIVYDQTHVIEWNQNEFNHLISRYFEIQKNFKSGSFFNYYPINLLISKILKPELCILAKKSY